VPGLAVAVPRLGTGVALRAGACSVAGGLVTLWIASLVYGRAAAPRLRDGRASQQMASSGQHRWAGHGMRAPAGHAMSVPAGHGMGEDRALLPDGLQQCPLPCRIGRLAAIHSLTQERQAGGLVLEGT